MNPVVAAGMLLPVYVVSDMFGLYAYRHAFDRRVLAILLPGAVVGIGVGWATATVVPESAFDADCASQSCTYCIICTCAAQALLA